jgi:outer membrane protein TolC
LLYGKCTRSKTLSLKDAITYALENKSDAKKARLKVENSKYQIQEVRSRALPKITANGGLTYNPILQTTFLDAGSLAVIQALLFKRLLVKMDFHCWGILDSKLV